MRKLLFVLSLLLLCSLNLLAQSPARATIKGVICDSAGITIPSATVMLLSTKDSTLLNFTSADNKGEFEFKNIKNSGYLLKVSLMSYYPYQQNLKVSATEINDLGEIKLKMVATMLLEVVIKAARAPLKFRGDTVEYDASSFKVPPGSTVEDLLRRLPGLEVDADGNIKSGGKNVTRLYVEGKTFFGDDPKFATKNLGAEAISKVQVFDDKTEQSKLTGIDDGVKDTKAMNLSLKEEYKKGAFGKLTVGKGDQDRWALKGNYNKFDKVQQFSVIGFGNNINQTGVNWDDYSEFRGQSSSVYDNGDFGFGSSNGMVIYMDNGGLNNYSDGRGLSKNYGSGINYNFDNKKTKFNSNYSYNQTSQTLTQTSNRQTFLENTSFKNADTAQSTTFSGYHMIGLRLEHNIDSSDLLIVKANLNFTNSNNERTQFSLYRDASDLKTRSLDTRYNNDLSSWNLNSAAIFRHQFAKKGKSFSWSGGFNSSESNGLENPFSINKFFEATTFSEQVIALNTNNNNSTNQFKSSMLLTQPLSKVFFIEAFYNFNASNNIQDKLTQNSALQNIRVDSLTAYFRNDVMFNRIGTTFRYSNKGLNATIGIGAQQLQLKGNNMLRSDLPSLKDPINKTYSNLIPDVSLRYQLTKSIYLSTSYTVRINEPSMNQLMPIANVNNPAFITQGNPSLEPQRNHSVSMSGSYSNQAAMSSMYLSLYYQVTENSIIYNQFITMVDKVGMQTISRPENMNGSNSFRISPQFNFPLVKTKATMFIYGGYGLSHSPTFVNNIKNITTTNQYNIQTSINLTFSQKLLLSINGSMNFNNMTYSFRTDLNQKIRNYSSNSTLKWQFATKSYLESNFSYTVYKNQSFGFNQNIPAWNASVRQILGKTNRIELRLAAFDIFNKNRSISQYATQNYVISTAANTLARYFMLSFSYNIKGFDIKSSNRSTMY
jgi:hypothetical protein